MSERIYNVFDFIIKNAVKLALGDGDYSKIQSVQTRAAAEKSVNAIFCPLFRRLKDLWWMHPLLRLC